jgi:ABC-type nickel/cobalt efflux system permease component RcnA
MTIVSRRFGRFLCLLFMLSLCRMASAHPMGNFSVNHYSKISLDTDRIRVQYFIDLAEIPTYQELQQANILATAIDPSSLEVIRYIAARGAELGLGLSLDVDGKPTLLHLISSGAIFPPGAGGLLTMKMSFVYDAAYPPTLSAQTNVDRRRVSLHYADNNYPGHTGWKEIIVQASTGTLLRSSVPATDRSGELSNYPTDLLTSPPQDLEASVVAELPASPVAAAVARPHSASEQLPRQAETKIGGRSPLLNHSEEEARSTLSPTPTAPVVTHDEFMQPVSMAATFVRLQANRQQTPRNSFTELIQAQHLSACFLFTAAIIAIGLGGLHALEPGHGKTIVAAYLVGSRGTSRHAVLLGMIVTASHTASVFALGAITLYASRYIVPEQLYPWLGALSGITISGLGCYMLLRRLSGTAADHSHVSGEAHGHWMFWRRAADGETKGNPLPSSMTSAQTVSLTQLLTLGITGGIIPCPAALIVLLSAFALHRIALGFFLIVAFSIGLAAVLIGFGMLMVYARRFMTRLQIDGPLTRRWLPAASSAFIAILGLIVTVQALSAVHLDLQVFSKERIGPILFVTGLGLILGMKHSTDADHVVAISTIVSGQRSIRNAAFIGSVWGMGHTITIFIVGSLIILFGVEIPPRVGLSMEFSVAVMLILLGLLNLTGVTQKVATRFTPVIADRMNTLVLEQREARTTRMERVRQNSVGRFGLYQCLRPLVIGLVHGLAGSAAVALLVLSTIHNPVWATVYLLIFGAGTMIGMMCMTAAIAVPLTFAGDRFAKLSQYLGVASGMVSLCFGSLLVYQLGFLGGLFTSHPEWTPR